MTLVTPHVGVWIETFVLYPFLMAKCVTPHVGVWIETWTYTQREDYVKSHLM